MMEKSEKKKTAVIWAMAPLVKFTEMLEDVTTLLRPFLELWKEPVFLKCPTAPALPASQ